MPFGQVLALSLVACRETDDYLYVSDVVWSDDDERAAYAIQRFDVSYPSRDPRNTRNENHRFEVWTSALDGSDREQWSDGDRSARFDASESAGSRRRRTSPRSRLRSPRTAAAIAGFLPDAPPASLMV
jgi:hypothetical protein